VVVAFEEHVNRPAVPFYGDCATTYTTTYGLGADAKYLGGLGYGRTSFGRRSGVFHAPIVDHQEGVRKPFEAILAALASRKLRAVVLLPAALEPVVEGRPIGVGVALEGLPIGHGGAFEGIGLL